MFSFSNGFSDVSVSDLKKVLEDKKTIVIDVRTPEEYKEEHIAGTTLIPLNHLENEVEKLFPDKDQIIYLHCRSGGRSSVAASLMLSLGYKKVFNVTGGILAWKNSGYKTVS